MIRAVMICDYNNPTSVAYSKIALDTWKDVKNVEVERFQCYTPDTLDTAQFEINWGKYSSAGKYTKNRHEITPTEKACLTSMFHWWKHIADTGERVIVLEHDAYVRDPKKLMQLVDNIHEKDLWCAGIAMECTSLHPGFAKYCMKKWLTIKEQIDAGPMAELWTAILEYTDYLGRNEGQREAEIKKELGVESRKRLLWPTLFSNNTLGEGNSTNRVLKGKIGFQKAPVTQCYYPKVDSTIEHHKKLGSVYQSGTFRQMEILESLYEPRSKTSSS